MKLSREKQLEKKVRQLERENRSLEKQVKELEKENLLQKRKIENLKSDIETFCEEERLRQNLE